MSRNFLAFLVGLLISVSYASLSYGAYTGTYSVAELEGEAAAAGSPPMCSTADPAGTYSVTGTSPVYANYHANVNVPFHTVEFFGGILTITMYWPMSTGSYYHYYQRKSYNLGDTPDAGCPDYVPPPVSDPGHCSNGVPDGMPLEEGIDCGGECSAACIEACPSGSSPRIITWSDYTTISCISDTGAVPAGPGDTCPTMYAIIDGQCSPIAAASPYKVPEGQSELAGTYTPPSDDPWNPQDGATASTGPIESSTVQNADGSTTTTDSQASSVSIPSGGGTMNVVESSATTTNTDGSSNTVNTTDRVVTNADGTTSRQIVTDTTTRDSFGNVTGTNRTVQNLGDGPALALPDDQETPSGFSAVGDPDGTVDGEGVGRYGSRVTAFADAVKGAAVFGAFDNIFSGPSSSGSSTFSLSFGSYGSQTFDLAEFDSVWSVLGGILVALALVQSSRLIIINK